MKILKLTVANFRGFSDDNTFRMSERFTVIAGVNGRGKTSLLDGLALLLSRFFRSLDLSAGRPRAVLATDVFDGKEEASLSMNVRCGGLPLRFSIEFQSVSSRVRAQKLPKDTKALIDDTYGHRDRKSDRVPVAIYYTTDRAGMGRPQTLPAQLPTGRQLAYSGALTSRLVDYRDFMARYRVWCAQERSREIGAVKRALGVFLEGFSNLQVETQPLRLTVRKGDSRLSINQLSDGERSFIAILGDMIRRLALANPDLDDPLQGHGVVLIDELELHLHPTWQRQIVGNLRETFPNIEPVPGGEPIVGQSVRIKKSGEKR